MMPTVPSYPEEDWMLRLGLESGSRKRFNEPPPMDVIRVGPQAVGGGEDYSRWEKLPKSTNIEDVRGEQPVREPGEMLAHFNTEQKNAYLHHTSNLRQGGVKQTDGGISTYRAIGVQIGNKHYMIPTIWDNEQLSNKEAVKRAKDAGLESWPSGKTRKEAEKAYNEVHKYMEEDLSLTAYGLGMRK